MIAYRQLLSLFCLLPFVLSAADRPNILFIFSDDHAPHAIGAYGAKLGVDTTPNIDKLAKQGMIFDRSYCTNSICGPSRAVIQTGLHSHRNGFLSNAPDQKFDGTQQTFPKLLHEAGYQTALFGKWHLVTEPTGFDDWAIYPGQGDYYNPAFITREGRKVIQGYSTDIVTNMTLEWLRKHRQEKSDKPFLLMMQHKAPHRNWLPGPEDLPLWRDHKFPEPATLFDTYEGRGPGAAEQTMTIEKHMTMASDLQMPLNQKLLNSMTPEVRQLWLDTFQAENEAFLANPPTGRDLVRWKYQRYMRNYLQSAHSVDRSVGNVLAELDALGLAANTIVVYSSDQGFYLGEHGWFDKRWIYEESVRMPLIVRWPGRIAPDTRSDALVQNIDYAPTFLAAAGITPPKPMHGISLLPLLTGATKTIDRDALYYHYYSDSSHNVIPHYGVITERYKFAVFYQKGTTEPRYVELHDRKADPAEMKSLHDNPEYAEIRTKLTQQLRALREQYNDTSGPAVP